MFRPVFFFITFILITAVPAAAQAAIQTSAKQAVVVDYQTGAVLLEKNADMQMPTSSMSKVMTMYMVFDALKRGKISLEDTFTVSEKAWRKGGSKMFVEVDKKVKILDLIRGVIVQSGNDATIVLAEGLAGSEEAFAAQMTEKAGDLGMNNSNFTNASGWPDPDHYSTARDLAVLAKAIIRDFPEYYKYYAEEEFTYNSITQANRNPLLYKNIGADGIKTGHTEAGGYGLIGSGVHDGRRVIFVINGLEDERARAEEAGKILEWGLKRFENYKLFTSTEAVANAQVALGKKSSVALSVPGDLLVTIPKGARDDIKVTAQYQAPLIAPLKKDQVVGEVVIDIPGMQKQTLPLSVSEDVNEQGFFVRTFSKMKMFLKGSV